MGSQEAYAEYVYLWMLYHDTQPDKTPVKIPKNLQGVVMKSQLLGRAKDVARQVTSEVLITEKGGQAIVNAVDKRDRLSVVNDIYTLINDFVVTKRNDNE